VKNICSASWLKAIAVKFSTLLSRVSCMYLA